MDLEKLHLMLGEVGPMDDRIMEVARLQEAGAGWVVRFQHVDVRVQHLAEYHKVGFSVAMDGPPQEKSATAFRALLAANGLWRQNGGLRFALGSSDNLIELSVELGEENITAKDIAIYCRGLAEHAATWALIFQGRVSAEPESAIAPDFNSDFIRL